MEIKIIQNQTEWDRWLLSQPEQNNFLQSWAWGDILITEGKKVERLAVVENENILAQAQMVYMPVFFGWQYAFCPKGPIESSKLKVESHKVLLEYLKNKNCIFLRYEPENIQYPISNIQIKKTIDINPSATLFLDLNKTEAELLAGMHQKTRYNVHLAEKKSIEISQEKNLDVFWDLMNKTGSRDKFGLHHKSHYEKVLAAPIVYQLTAYEKNHPIACAVFTRFGNTFTYLYGASDYKYRNIMAPYLLQWQGIKMGKSFGCQWYDFFGVAPRLQSVNNKTVDYPYDPKHQYAGVTRFKLGFGGKPRKAPGTVDLVIDQHKYLVYNFLRRLRRLF